MTVYGARHGVRAGDGCGKRPRRPGCAAVEATGRSPLLPDISALHRILQMLGNLVQHGLLIGAGEPQPGAGRDIAPGDRRAANSPAELALLGAELMCRSVFLEGSEAEFGIGVLIAQVVPQIFFLNEDLIDILGLPAQGHR
jgi:hypothetical protein